MLKFRVVCWKQTQLIVIVALSFKKDCGRLSRVIESHAFVGAMQCVEME